MVGKNLLRNTVMVLTAAIIAGCTQFPAPAESPAATTVPQAITVEPVREPELTQPDSRAPSGDEGGSQAPAPLATDAVSRTVYPPVAPTSSIALAKLPPAKPNGRPVKNRGIPKNAQLNVDLGPQQVDPVLQLPSRVARASPAPLFSIDGITNAVGVTPPDTIGDIGPTHYVQMVNATWLQVFTRTGTTLTPGIPVQLNMLWSAGNCRNTMRGDPVVLYDNMADRWLLAQFSTANAVCIALSQTGNPLGMYWLYEFATPQFPDYFKISAWNDGYYMSANESSYTAYVFDRANMLQGNSASSVRFAGQTNFLLSADVDGPAAPPPATPGLFYTFKDGAYHGGGVDRLELFTLSADWVTPANSTFTLLASVPISDFNFTVCGFFNFDCVSQPDTAVKLDSVSEWPMWRLQYRNFGAYETLVGNFAVDATGTDVAGIRWFELRKTGAGVWSLYQQSTWAPDGESRFMGSIAMDGFGNIALGYTASSASIYPSLRYATRAASDPLGTLRSEAELHAGAGSQTSVFNRWGDYSSLNVDPLDDCTFWYTNEYYAATSATGWSTRIGSFRMPGCPGVRVYVPITSSP